MRGEVGQPGTGNPEVDVGQGQITLVGAREGTYEFSPPGAPS